MEEAVLYAALCPLGKEHQAAWDLLALVLAREAGLSALPEVAKGEEGKPFFPGRPDICFNLSHSHGAVACAVHNRDIGVDIELVRQPPKLLGQGMEPEAFFWPNYAEILAGWSSCAVSFDETGMTVGFSPYELAAYAAGAQVYHLDYDWIAGYPSGHGLAVLGLADVEK